VFVETRAAFDCGSLLMICPSTVFVCNLIIDEMLQGRLTSRRADTGLDFMAAAATVLMRRSEGGRVSSAFEHSLCSGTITNVRRRPRPVARGRHPVQRERARARRAEAATASCDRLGLPRSPRRCGQVRPPECRGREPVRSCDYLVAGCTGRSAGLWLRPAFAAKRGRSTMFGLGLIHGQHQNVHRPG